MSASRKRSRANTNHTTATATDELSSLEYEAAILEQHIHAKTQELNSLRERIDYLRLEQFSGDAFTASGRPRQRRRRGTGRDLTCKFEGCTKKKQRFGFCCERECLQTRYDVPRLLGLLHQLTLFNLAQLPFSFRFVLQITYLAQLSLSLCLDCAK